MITNVYNIKDNVTNEIVGYKMVLNNGKESILPDLMNNSFSVNGHRGFSFIWFDTSDIKWLF